MKKAKVLLITPNLKGIGDGVNRIQPSLGLLLIAPILEQNGHDVKIYDAALDGWNNRSVIDKKNNIVMIGQTDDTKMKMAVMGGMFKGGVRVTSGYRDAEKQDLYALPSFLF